MKKSQQRKLERKRRAEREKRKEAAPLAYHGRKYRTEALMPVLLATETAIYEGYVISDRSLTDHDVRDVLEQLILEMRKGQIDLEQVPARLEGDLREIVKMNILSRWRAFVEESAHPGRDNLIGVLRTVLGSVENHATLSRSSKEYLKFIEEFMRKAGINVKAISKEEFRARFPDAPEPLENPLSQNRSSR